MTTLNDVLSATTLNDVLSAVPHLRDQLSCKDSNTLCLVSKDLNATLSAPGVVRAYGDHYQAEKRKGWVNHEIVPGGDYKTFCHGNTVWLKRHLNRHALTQADLNAEHAEGRFRARNPKTYPAKPRQLNDVVRPPSVRPPRPEPTWTGWVATGVAACATSAALFCGSVMLAASLALISAFSAALYWLVPWVRPTPRTT